MEERGIKEGKLFLKAIMCMTSMFSQAVALVVESFRSQLPLPLIPTTSQIPPVIGTKFVLVLTLTMLLFTATISI